MSAVPYAYLGGEYNGHDAKNEVAANQVQDRPGKVVLVRRLSKDYHVGLSRYNDSMLRLATIVCCLNNVIAGNCIGSIDPLARWNGRVALWIGRGTLWIGRVARRTGRVIGRIRRVARWIGRISWLSRWF